MNQSVLHLSLIEGIGPATISRILNALSTQQLAQLYSFTPSDFVEHCNLSPLTAAKVVAGLADRVVVERELSLMHKHAISVVTLSDTHYPSLLKQIYLPPPVLYYKGALKDAKALAIVGSRQAQSYAQRVINALVPPLVENRWTIVSGGALGADTFAHQAAIKAGGLTQVVLGSGLLERYPRENNRLYDEIVHAGGALISPFALQQRPLPGNFPARNRIIAGLSNGCLVVQAAEKSGARITAQFALEQGKDVFVVPGIIDDPLNAGSHLLIQQGAKLVTNAYDIALEFNEPLVSLSAEQDIQKVRQLTIPVKKQYHSSVVQQHTQDPLLALCARPISSEELAQQAHLSLTELQQKLFNLQLEGKITQDFAGLWHCS